MAGDPERNIIARRLTGGYRLLVLMAAALIGSGLLGLRGKPGEPLFNSALAQSPTPPLKPKGASPMEIVRNCPAGHRIEFALPATTLYLDIHWLGSGTIIDLFDAYGINCPSGPVKVGRVEFRGAALRLLDLHSGLGEGAGVFRLYAGGDPDLPGRPRVKPSRSTEYHSEPWVEDDTMLKRIPDVRSYRLYYPGASGGPDYMIRITCSGEFSHRECATDDSFDGSSSYEAFYISYHLPQNKLPIPPMSQLYPTDPTTEPGALLQFNAHFRAWLATLKQKP